MAISYVGAGAFNAGTTSATSNYPAGAAEDAILTLIGHKPFSSTATATGYTGLGSITSGSVANAVSSGSVRATAGLKNTTPTAAGGDTISVASGSPTMAIGLRFATSTSGAVWSVAAIGVADTNENLLAVDANDGGGSAAGFFQAGDMVAISVVLKDDAITHTSQSFTIAGCTLGTITWLARQTTTTGNDGAMYIGYVAVTAGSSNGVTQYTATSNTAGASACACNVVRLREVPPPLAPTSFSATDNLTTGVDTSWTAPGSGTAPTSYNVYRGSNELSGDSSTFTSSEGLWVPASGSTVSAVGGWLRVTNGSNTGSFYRAFYLSSTIGAGPAVAPGDILRVTGDMRQAAGSVLPRMIVDWYDSTPSLLSSSTVATGVGGGSTTSFDTSLTAPATAASYLIRFGGATSSSVANDQWELDNVQIAHATAIATGVATTSYSDTTAVAGTTYVYWSAGVASGVEGAASNTDTGTRLTAAGPPRPVQLVTQQARIRSNLY